MSKAEREFDIVVYGATGYTGSRRAQQILAEWAASRGRFVKVFPKEYRRALGELAQAHKKAAA